MTESTLKVPWKLSCSDDEPIQRFGKTTKSLLFLFSSQNLSIILSSIILSVLTGKWDPCCSIAEKGTIIIVFLDNLVISSVVKLFQNFVE